MIGIAIRRVLQEIIWRVGLLVCRRWFGLDVSGVEHLRRHRCCLIVANHTSHLDGPAILAAQGAHYRRVTTLAARDYFFRGRVRSWLSRWVLNLLPIDRGRLDTGAVASCRERVRDGHRLVMFPEGTRSTTGEMLPFRPGFGFLAQHLGLPVVPAYIEGTFESLPKGRLWPRRRRLRVSFGPAVGVRHAGEVGAKAGEIAKAVNQSMHELGARSTPQADAEPREASL